MAYKTVQRDHHSIVKLSDDCYELAGKAKRLHYFPRALSAYRIEGLGQVKEGHEVVMLLLAFFPGAGMQQISCQQFQVLSRNHT